MSSNHNETFLALPPELTAEELEAVIAPGVSSNHNETFLAAPPELVPEEM